MGLLQTFFYLCLLTLSAVASATSPTNTSNMAAQRNSTIDPLFARWLPSDAPLNFALWVEEIGALLSSIDGRLNRLSGNLDILLQHYAEDTRKNREKWRGCLESHGIGLENKFAQLRYRFFTAYAFYLARASPILEQLEELKPHMTALENRYIEALSQIEGSLGERILGEIGLPEKFLQSGNTIIGTWLSHLRISSKHDPASPGLSGPHTGGVLEYLSELLYWLEVAAIRKDYASRPPYGSYSEERQQAWVDRDAFIAERIRTTEQLIRQMLKKVTMTSISISMEMANGYIQSFRERAMALGYNEAAQGIVMGSLLSRHELLYDDLVYARFPDSVGGNRPSFDATMRMTDSKLAAAVVDLFIMLHKRSFDKKVNGKLSTGRDPLEDLAQLNRSISTLGGVSVFMRAFSLPDCPRDVLRYIWAMANCGKASDGCDPDSEKMTDSLSTSMAVTEKLLNQFGDKLKNYEWLQPTTLREALELARDALLAWRQSALSNRTMTSLEAPPTWSECLNGFHAANVARGVDPGQLSDSDAPVPNPAAPTNQRRTQLRGNGRSSRGLGAKGLYQKG